MIGCEHCYCTSKFVNYVWHKVCCNCGNKMATQHPGVASLSNRPGQIVQTDKIGSPLVEERLKRK